jgi:Zn-dependent protease with chaperone function
MSRFLLLFVFVLWMSCPEQPVIGGSSLLVGAICFLGFYAFLVGIMGLWSRWMARRVHFGDFHRRVQRFNRVMFFAQLMVPAWYAVGVLALGWKMLVTRALAQTPLVHVAVDFPSVIVGSFPAFLAWMGLWWAQYPADRALREQNAMIELEQDFPIHAPPTFWVYFGVNFRLQLLFAIAPVLLLVLMRDVLSLSLAPIFHHVPWLQGRETLMESLISFPSFAVILLFGPELLRRVLHTDPMPDTPLRRRLENMCKEHGVGYRDVLLWRTQHYMGNAAVMGFIPQVRYILLSDLLLETMDDDQIEAVFAHEVGHVIHRHLYWLVAAMATLLMALSGPGQSLVDSTWFQHLARIPDAVQVGLLLAMGLGIFLLVFGWIMRKFERQADVFAARVIQSRAGMEAVLPSGDAAGDSSGVSSDGVSNGISNGVSNGESVSISDLLLNIKSSTAPAIVYPRLSPASLGIGSPTTGTFVGTRGAEVFCSALEKVAHVNNIPIMARSWCHGSIAKRMQFLVDVSADPARTARFDRFMSRLYLSLTASLCIFGAWTMVTMWQQPATDVMTPDLVQQVQQVHVSP